MARILMCIQYDESAAQCTQEAWVDQSDWTHYLPTVDQANEVGMAFFVSVMTLAVINRLLFPPKEREIE